MSLCSNSGCDSSVAFCTYTCTHRHLMSWLCLLVVHLVIEMGVWVLLGCKSACQLAFSTLFPISIKHPHHLLWDHSTSTFFSPEPCSADRWCALSANHFSRQMLLVCHPSTISYLHRIMKSHLCLNENLASKYSLMCTILHMHIMAFDHCVINSYKQQSLLAVESLSISSFGFSTLLSVLALCVKRFDI